MKSSDFSRHDVDRIVVLCDVAKVNGAALTLKDVVALTEIDATEEQLERLWENNDVLSSTYYVDSGYIFEKNPRSSSPTADISRYLEDRSRADQNLRRAKRFASFITSRAVKVVAVSGSTSYDSARRADDVDFFCVVANDELWVFMLNALLLARINRLTHSGEPAFCFSCVMDEGMASEEFGAAKDPLFARDALTARAISGQEYLQRLLASAIWMRSFYPKLYWSKVRGKSANQLSRTSRSPLSRRILNSFLYVLVGRYVALKANLLNRRLAREGENSSVFAVRLGEDHCIYESARYKQLRKSYSKFPEGLIE